MGIPGWESPREAPGPAIEVCQIRGFEVDAPYFPEDAIAPPIYVAQKRFEAADVEYEATRRGGTGLWPGPHRSVQCPQSV